MSALGDRLVKCWPSGTFALPALLRVLRIEESERVATACIECRRRPRLLVNPRFVARHAATPEKLLMLVMHELHHLLLGHTRRKERPTPLKNLVFDALINAQLCQLLPEAEHVAFFTDLYDDRDFPHCFLRPGPAWIEQASCREEERRAWCPRALHDGAPGILDAGALAELHEQLYRRGAGVTASELEWALTRHAELKAGQLDSIVLLGGHEEAPLGLDELRRASPVLLGELRRLAGRLGSGPGRATELDYERLMQPTVIELRQRRDRALTRLLRRIGGRRGSGWRSRRDGAEAGLPARGPLVRPDRRSLVQRALGQRPLTADQAVPARRPRGDERVHVYLDVSSSVDELLPELAGVLLRSRALLRFPLHQFSNAVHDVSLPQLRRGEVRSTGGTDVECIAEHARRHGVRRAVIVTDGYVGSASGEALATLRDMRLGVALTGDGELEPGLAEAGPLVARLGRMS